MRSILLHIHDGDGLDTRIKAAITLARAFAGHITCLHVVAGHDGLARSPIDAGELPADFIVHVERLRLGLRGRIEATLEAAAVSWTWVDHDGPLAAGFIEHSMLADVIVLSLPGHDATAQESSFVGSVVTHGRAPVLAVPKEGPTLGLVGPALVAWDGSPEASAAMRASIPLLKQARSVRLVEIDEGGTCAKADEAGVYLSRHGVDARVIQRMATRGGAGAVILATAEKVGASLIVMGAYSHSRLSEYLLGGATRTMLASSPVALLLAH